MQELREIFHVEQPLSTVWRRLSFADDGTGCRIPGFPSLDGKSGCRAKVLCKEAQRLLRVVKEDQPCIGSKIDIDVSPANAAGWPTRVTVAQSGLPAAMEAMSDAVHAHWQRIVADFRLYLEREALAPAAAWGTDLGATTEQTPTGLVLRAVRDGGFAQRCGMMAGDLLLTVRGVRIYDVGELWTVLALSRAGEATEATWIRERVCSATASL